MYLFKAINYDEGSPLEMTSIFNDEYNTEACWEDMIRTAFSHVSHGDKKKAKKDYWISATRSYETAIDYLNNPNYSFNGIAIIDLPNTHKTGYIYDSNLREYGYVEKESKEPSGFKNLWTPNTDGIVVVLDMSSDYTINYLASYLWLKGNQCTLGNIRTYNYAKKDDEVLILGQGIKFSFLNKDKANEVAKTCYNFNNNITDYNSELFSVFIKYAPQSPFKDKLLETSEQIVNFDDFDDFYCDKLEYIKESLNDENVFLDNLDFYIDQSEVEEEYKIFQKNNCQNDLMRFYENATYSFNRSNVLKRFNEFSKLNYADCDIIDFDRYKLVEKISEISLDDYLYAYIYSACYIQLKSSDKIPTIRLKWKTLNYLYGDKFITQNIGADDFFNYYNNSLGILAGPSTQLKTDFQFFDF